MGMMKKNPTAELRGRFRGPGRSDALVVFGITGDLAYKQILPALYSLTKRGALNVARSGCSVVDLEPRGASKAGAE